MRQPLNRLFTVIVNPFTHGCQQVNAARISGKFDMTFPNDLTVPLQKNIESQMSDAICEMTPQGGQNRNLPVNRDKPPLSRLSAGAGAMGRAGRDRCRRVP